MEQEIHDFIMARFPDEDPERVFTVLIRVAGRICMEAITAPGDRARMDLEGFTPLDKASMVKALAPFQRALEGLFDVQD